MMMKIAWPMSWVAHYRGVALVAQVRGRRFMGHGLELHLITSTHMRRTTATRSCVNSPNANKRQ